VIFCQLFLGGGKHKVPLATKNMVVGKEKCLTVVKISVVVNKKVPW
jgi:hypothetical protein